MTHPRAGFYDRWAPSFDAQQASLAFTEGPAVRGVLERLSGARALDLGCGTGRHLPLLLERYARVHAVDFSAGMLARVREKFADVPPERLRVEQADATEVDLPEGAYDLVLSAMALGGIRGKGKLLERCARALAPGGRLVLSTYHPMQALLRRALQADVDGGRVAIEFSEVWMVEDYHAALRASGLDVLRILEPRVTDAMVAATGRHAGEVGWPHVLVVEAASGAPRA